MTTPRPGTVLLVEEGQATQSLQPILAAAGYSARVCPVSGPASLDREAQADLLILDARVREDEAAEIATRWLARDTGGPVLVIAKSQEVGRWVGVGVDLLVDPFYPRDLLERVRAHLEGPEPQNPIVQLEACIVDLAGQRVHRDGEELPLTTMECHLLGYLAANPKRAIPRDELLKRVWNYARSVTSRTTDTCVRRLRIKVEKDPSKPRHIRTVQGVGYRFEPMEASELAPAPAAVPPPKPQPRRTNLTTHPATFVGRTRDLEDLHTAFSDPSLRLLTLLGPAGTGKTRVALRFGEQHLARDPDDSVWFVDLTAARSLGDVLIAVATALGVPTGDCDEEELVGRIGTSLAGRGRILLLLDNFEQVAPTAPETLPKWLHAAGNARFLVTSRERLRLDGEALLALPPLEQADAVELFVVRAQAARPSFDPGDAEREALTEIVTRLDQLPLAIELAAARMAVLSPQKLLGRMDQRFDLLQEARRGGHGRQATMWGAIRWSWDLLEPAEQRALAQCAVFRGGFFLEDAEVVVELGPGAPTVLEVVEALRDKSMLRAWELEGLDGELRFGMYESIREFAWEQLPEGEREPTSDRHARHYLKVCEELASGVNQGGGLERLLRLAAERENLLGVYRRWVSRDVDTASRAAMCLLELHGPQQAHLSEFAPLFDRLADLGPRARIELLCHRAASVALRGDAEGATRDFSAALEVSLTADDRGLEARVRWQFGAMLAWRGEADAGVEHLEAALSRFLEIKDRFGEACARYQLGNLYKGTSRVELARRHIRLALTAAREVGARRQEALILHVYGSIERGTDPQLAEQYLQTALSIVRTYDDRAAEGMIRSDLGRVYQETKRLTEAEVQFTEALKLLTEAGHHAVRAHPLTFLGSLHHDRGDLNEARRLYKEALEITVETGQRVGHGLLCGYLGLLAHERRRVDEAESCYRTGAFLLEESGGHGLLPFFLAGLCALLVEQGDASGADEVRRRVEAMTDHMGPPIRAATRLLLALAGNSDAASATETAERARHLAEPFFEESKDVRLAMRLLSSRHA